MVKSQTALWEFVLNTIAAFNFVGTIFMLTLDLTCISIITIAMLLCFTHEWSVMLSLDNDQCNNYNQLTMLLQCHYTIIVVYTSDFYIVMSHCHNIVTMLYADIVYRCNITLSFDGPATNIWVHRFKLRQIQTWHKSLLTMLWQHHFVCWVVVTHIILT